MFNALECAHICVCVCGYAHAILTYLCASSCASFCAECLHSFCRTTRLGHWWPKLLAVVVECFFFFLLPMIYRCASCWQLRVRCSLFAVRRIEWNLSHIKHTKNNGVPAAPICEHYAARYWNANVRSNASVEDVCRLARCLCMKFNRSKPTNTFVRLSLLPPPTLSRKINSKYAFMLINTHTHHTRYA